MTAPTDPTQATAKPKLPRPEQDPRQRELQRLFTAWIKHPEEDRFFHALRVAMRSHELRTRLQRAIPAPSIPSDSFN